MFRFIAAIFLLLVFNPSHLAAASGASAVKVDDDHYCDNRGSSGGTGDYSKKVASGDIRACVQFVENNPKCSPHFSLGSDGYCDCAPVGKTCGAEPFNAYDTYKLVSGTDCWNAMGNAYVDLRNTFCGGGFCTTEAQALKLEEWYPTSIANGEGGVHQGRKEGASCQYIKPHNCWNAMGNRYRDLQDTYCGGGICTTEAQALKLEEWYPTSIANGEGGVHQGRKEGASCQYIRSHPCWNAMGNRYKDLRDAFCEGGICVTEKHGNTLLDWYPSSIKSGEGGEGKGRKEGDRCWNRRVFGGEGGTYFSPKSINSFWMHAQDITHDFINRYSGAHAYYPGMTALSVNEELFGKVHKDGYSAGGFTLKDGEYIQHLTIRHANNRVHGLIVMLNTGRKYCSGSGNWGEKTVLSGRITHIGGRSEKVIDKLVVEGDFIVRPTVELWKKYTDLERVRLSGCNYREYSYSGGDRVFQCCKGSDRECKMDGFTEKRAGMPSIYKPLEWCD